MRVVTSPVENLKSSVTAARNIGELHRTRETGSVYDTNRYKTAKTPQS